MNRGEIGYRLGLTALVILVFTLVVSYVVSEPINKKGALEFEELIRQQAVKHNVHPLILGGVVACESNFDPRAKSHTKDYGLAQLNIRTANILRPGTTVKDLFDPKLNLDLAAQYINRLNKRYKIPMPDGIDAYNIGPTAWKKGRRNSHYRACVLRNIQYLHSLWLGYTEDFFELWKKSQFGADHHAEVAAWMIDGDLLYKGWECTRLGCDYNELWPLSYDGVVHTHPNSSSKLPSKQDIQLAKAIGAPVYTVTDEIWAAMPSDGRLEKIAEFGWWKDLTNVSEYVIIMIERRTE